MKILIVEDNADQQNSYQDNIIAINTTGGEQIIPTIKGTLADALKELEQSSFDAAIVDLKLSGNQDEAEGNKLLREIVNKKRFPVFVYSAHLGEIDPDITPSAFFQIFSKTTLFSDLISKLRDIYKTGVTKILGRDGEIDRYLAKVFWENIVASFDELSGKGMTEAQLLRYIAGHLQEHLELDHKGNFEDHFTEEVYIQPSIKPNFFTGSIIKRKDTEEYSIILTPQCDMAHANAQTQILAARVHDGHPFSSYLADFKHAAPDPATATQLQIDKHMEKRKKAEEALGNMIHNKYSQKHYFLPKHREFPGGLVHFQDLFPISGDKINGEFDHIATINASFLKDIVARFAFYYSRQGAPDLKISIFDL
jgi:CheY-like chemotaxis protein